VEIICLPSNLTVYLAAVMQTLNNTAVLFTGMIKNHVIQTRLTSHVARDLREVFLESTQVKVEINQNTRRVH
jgi:hypothetical protein